MDYRRIYDQLTNRAKVRGDLLGYFERHHVVPKCLGGNDNPDNLIVLTAREHFLAHWLLFKIYGTPALAKAFRLMVDSQKRARGRSYAKAKEIYALSMSGNNNVAKRADVRQKLRENCYSSFAGKRRPDHANLLRRKGVWSGTNNPGYGKGHLQLGKDNPVARSVFGVKDAVCKSWSTLTEAAADLGVSKQAIRQAILKKQRSRGWTLEYAL